MKVGMIVLRAFCNKEKFRLNNMVDMSSIRTRGGVEVNHLFQLYLKNMERYREIKMTALKKSSKVTIESKL